NVWAMGVVQAGSVGRKCMARFDDVLDHLEAFEERVAINHYFHEVLQCCRKKERNNFVAVVTVERCGSGGSARNDDVSVSWTTLVTGISVWRSWGAVGITGCSW